MCLLWAAVISPVNSKIFPPHLSPSCISFLHQFLEKKKRKKKTIAAELYQRCQSNYYFLLFFLFFFWTLRLWRREGEDRELQRWGQLKRERRRGEEKIFPLAILLRFWKGTTFLVPYPSWQVQALWALTGCEHCQKKFGLKGGICSSVPIALSAGATFANVAGWLVGRHQYRWELHMLYASWPTIKTVTTHHFLPGHSPWNLHFQFPSRWHPQLTLSFYV